MKNAPQPAKSNIGCRGVLKMTKVKILKFHVVFSIKYGSKTMVHLHNWPLPEHHHFFFFFFLYSPFDSHLSSESQDFTDLARGYLNIVLFAHVYYTPVVGGVGGGLLFELVVFVVGVVKWWWWCLWSSSGGDRCCKVGYSDCCSVVIFKCICVGGGPSGVGGVVVVLVVVWYWWCWFHSVGGGCGMSLCKGGSFNSCRSAIVKCTIHGEGGEKVVMKVVLMVVVVVVVMVLVSVMVMVVDKKITTTTN